MDEYERGKLRAAILVIIIFLILSISLAAGVLGWVIIFHG